MKKSYTITATLNEGESSININQDLAGFSIIEIIGILEHAKSELVQKLLAEREPKVMENTGEATGYKPVSMQEMIEDSVFKDNVKSIVLEINNTISLRPSGRYKRQWFDRAFGNKNVKPEFFIDNIQSVLEGRSKLSSELRGVVMGICKDAIMKTINHYQNIK